MLQINSGKLYRQGVGRTNHLRGVLYTNLVLGGWGETPIVTAAGTLLTTDSSDHPAPLVYELTERMEDHGITQGVLVSHGVLPYLQDFAVVAAFFLQATCTPDVTLGARLLGPARSVTVATAPDRLVKGVFDKRVLVLPEDRESFARFVDELIGLGRKSFLAAMRAMRTYVTGLHRVADDLELAYAMLVASVESLAQDFDGHLGRWSDYAESKRGKIDAALEGADADVATRVRAAIMEIEHVALARRFRDFALEHVPRGSLRHGGRPGAPGRLDLRDGLAEAYRLRSRYVHNLLGLPRLLDSDFGFSETVRSGHSTFLTIEGIRRVARTVILEFVRRQPKVDAEEYDYGLERHGVVQAQLSPEYWIGRPELLDGSSGRQWLASFLQQFAGWLLAGKPGTDLGQVMLKVEVLLPGLKPKQRLPFVALYCTYAMIRPERERTPDRARLFDKWKVELDPPSVESLFVHLVLEAQPDWDLDDHKALVDTYFAQRNRKSGLRVPELFEAGAVLALAERFRLKGQKQAAADLVSFAAVTRWASPASSISNATSTRKRRWTGTC